MPRRPERIQAPIPEAEADVWSEPETNSDVPLSDKNSNKIDMETASVPRRPKRSQAPSPEAEADVWSEPETNSDVPLSDKNFDKIEMETDSVQSWDSQDASDEAEELGPVAVEASKTWTTLEDTDIHLAEQVASLLRPTPLLPPPLPAWSASMCAPASGIVYPAVHCAFAGCVCRPARAGVVAGQEPVHASPCLPRGGIRACSGLERGSAHATPSPTDDRRDARSTAWPWCAPVARECSLGVLTAT